MTEDQDNSGEVVANVVRVALTAAGQLAEQVARRREADLREAEGHSAARVATLQSQLAAERELTLRSVREVIQRGDAATVEEVVNAWEQARGFGAATMATERAQLEDRIRVRFGVDARSLDIAESTGARISAVALAVHDVDLQAGDAHNRSAARDRVDSLYGKLVNIGVDEEAAIARALAAESHPTKVTKATQQSPAAPIGRPTGRRRSRPVEVQGPDR